MPVELNRHTETILCAAVEISDPGQRALYLDDACRDDPLLRRDVERMVDDHFRAGMFLERPSSALPATDLQPPTERPGTQIGRYKLLEQIGEGGMGVVYVAEQTEPVRRRVALKIIKPGMDTRQVISRFEAERQALAMMDHPNIARVHDGGATDTGRPYFVMELVRGMPITEYSDQARLNPRGRLELFMTVCHAVQHAHQKGIIHRDIKPSNVLVTMHDDKPVVKVIDFGVAKAVNQQLTERTIYTAFTEMIGTPLYMSPEQAQLSGLDVDTRSDVYSLGVLLYELLTGHTPFDRDTLVKAGLDEVRRMIREDEPPRPSHRISTLNAEAGSTVGQRRGFDQRQLTRALHGELDWIVMKALEKDRNRRYESASAFAADIERHLNNEPVEACPRSAFYRFRKLARRRRGALVAITFVAASLLAGAGISLWQAAEANAARDIADRRARQAESNLRRGNEAVEILLARVEKEPLLDEPRFFQLRMGLLNDALRINSSFLDENPEDEEAMFETAKAYRRMADIYYRIGDPHKVAEASRQAIRLLDRLPTERSQELRYLRELANLYRRLSTSRFDGAPVGEYDSDLHRKSLLLQERLADASPNDPEALRQIAEACHVLGFSLQSSNLEESQAILRRGVTIAAKLVERHPERLDFQGTLARSRWFLGRMLHNSGNHHAAQEELQAALSASTETLHKAAESFEFRKTHVEILTSLSLLSAETSDKRGLSYAQQALSGAEELLNDYPFDNGCVHLVLVARTSVAHHLKADGKPDEALAVRVKSLEIAQRLYDEVPVSAIYGADLANAHIGLANSLRDKGDLNAALAQYGSAAEVLQQIIKKWPDYAEGKTRGRLCFALEGKNLRHPLSRILVDQGICHDLLGEFQEGTKYYEKAASLNNFWTRELSTRQLFWYADGLWETGRRDEARHAWAAAIERTRISFDTAPSDLVNWGVLAGAHYRLGQYEESLRLYQERIDILRSTTPPEDRSHEGDSGHFYCMAMNYASLGRREEAQKWFERGREWDRKYAADLDPEYKQSKQAIRQEAADVLEISDEPEKAEASGTPVQSKD